MFVSCSENGDFSNCLDPALTLGYSPSLTLDLRVGFGFCTTAVFQPRLGSLTMYMLGFCFMGLCVLV